MSKENQTELSEGLLELAEDNKKSLQEILICSNYDADYILEWGLPDYWTENFWSYPEYVVQLFATLVKKYSLNIPPSCFDSIDY